MKEPSRKHLPGEFNQPEPGLAPQAAEKMREEDLFIAKTFNSGAGKKVLEWLRAEYVNSTVEGFVVDRTGAINAAATTFDLYMKQGQKIVVKNIEMRIARANSSAIKPVKPKSDV